jgi:hypothetical protein
MAGRFDGKVLVVTWLGMKSITGGIHTVDGGAMA